MSKSPKRSPTTNKVLRAPKTPKTMPKKLVAATAEQRLASMGDASASVPRNMNMRRNTVSAHLMDSDDSKMVRRSARVMAKKAEWVCDDMPAPPTSVTKRIIEMKKSTAKKSARKTHASNDSDDNSGVVTRRNYVSLLPGDLEQGSGKASNGQTPTLNETGKKRKNIFEITAEDLSDISGFDLLSEDDNTDAPGPSNAERFKHVFAPKPDQNESAISLRSPPRMDDSETNSDAPGPSNAARFKHVFAPKTDQSDANRIESAASLKSPPRMEEEENDVSNVKGDKKNGTFDVSEVNGLAELKEDGNCANDTLPSMCLLPEQTGIASNEASKTSTNEHNESKGDKKNGTFDMPEEGALLTDDEGDVAGALPTVSMLGEAIDTALKLPSNNTFTEPKGDQKNGTFEISKQNESDLFTDDDDKEDDEERNNISKSVNVIDAKIARISIVDLTDSPVVPKSFAKGSVKIQVNDRTVVESNDSKNTSSKWMVLPKHKAKDEEVDSSTDSDTPIKRMVARPSTGATKKLMTSAKKRCLILMAKEAMVELNSSKHVAFSSPQADRRSRGVSIPVKKTPFKLPIEVQKAIENEEPKNQSAVGQKTPGKVPNFGKMHQKLFANMESVAAAVVRVDERAKTLLSGKKVPAVASIVKPVKSGSSIPTRRALQPQPQPNVSRNASVLDSKLRKVTKTIDRDERRKQMFKPTGKNTEPTTNRTARHGILKGVRTNRRFELLMQSRK